jgi:hypothetical protein
MSTYRAGTLTVRGVEVNIFTDDDGQWLAWLNGGADKVTAQSRDLLKTALSRKMRAAASDVAVPFLMLTETRRETVVVRSGVATGIHSSNRNVMVTWDDDGTKGQLSGVGDGKTMTGDTNPDEWREVVEAYMAASRAMYAFEQAHKIELRAEIRAALTRAEVAPDGQS